MSKRPSIREIARQADLAPITVSRVFSEPEQVAPKTRSRVLAIAEKLGYVHKRPPAQLHSHVNCLVGVILPGLQFSLFSDFIAGVQEVADAHSYDVLIGISNSDEQTEETIIRSMLARSADGLIIVGDLGKSAARLLHRQKKWLRVVQAWGVIEHPLDLQVAFDNRAAGELAARHFVERGYRHLAYAGSLRSRDGERWLGFRDTVIEQLASEPVQINLTPEVESEEFFLGCGKAVLNQLAELHQPVDALFCSIDEIAHGVQFEALRRKMRIPDDLALCGCGDRSFAFVVEPPLTTVAVPGRELGSRSAEVLLAGIVGSEVAQKVVFPPNLIVRRSS